ncbi:type I restriction-modification enzyme R subunit C-terminal domain-containing protein, partial [Microbacterium sp.]|uniref:type I restriction-modification enzyme R subunit C-terminal domain-containing protein n=1 Tax=Microbacterium sp. TaxID=51671 RepID=UPI003A8BDEAF
LRDAGAGPVDIVRANERGGGLGLFIRGLVGLDRSAATEAFANYLDETRFTLAQVRFVGLIVDELTRNGVMDPGRLFEAPYTDHAPTGPDVIFVDADVDRIVRTLRGINATAVPA